MIPHTSQLSGCAALVTGAGGEIGAVIARVLTEAGARVALVGRDLGRLRTAAARTGNAERHLLLKADVRSERDVRRAVAAAIKTFGRLDILVNNAGVRGPTRPLSRIRLQDWRDVFETNLAGSFLFSRECLPHLARCGRGGIVNISSVVSRWGYPLRAPYAASKAALNSLTLTLAQEAGPLGIRVNAILPGPVEGEALDRVIALRAAAMRVGQRAMRKQFLRPAALGRAVISEDVAQAVLFLCSPAANNITGQLVDISAGYGLWPGA